MNKIILKNQTHLVNKLLQLGEIEEINNEYLNEEAQEEGETQEVYMWLLIDSNYQDIFEKMDIPYIEYEGNFWIGQTWCGCSWEQSGYWKQLTTELPFLLN